jgi:hypothetical protein
MLGIPLAAAPEFAMNLSVPSATVTADRPAAVQLNLEPIHGFSGQLALSCSASEVSCSFQPASLNSGGKSTLILRLPSQQAGFIFPGFGPRYLVLAEIMSILVLCLLAAIVKTRRMRVAAFLTTILMIAAAIGCGDNGAKPETPFTITITASSSQSGVVLAHSLDLHVTVAH